MGRDSWDKDKQSHGIHSQQQHPARAMLLSIRVLLLLLRLPLILKASSRMHFSRFLLGHVCLTLSLTGVPSPTIGMSAGLLLRQRPVFGGKSGRWRVGVWIYWSRERKSGQTGRKDRIHTRERACDDEQSAIFNGVLCLAQNKANTKVCAQRTTPTTLFPFHATYAQGLSPCDTSDRLPPSFCPYPPSP